MRGMSPDGARLNQYGHAANLGEHVKRNEETREPGTHRGLTVDRLFHRFRGSLNVLGVEMIEDFEVLFKTLAYVRCHDRTVQRPLRSDRPTRILGIARAFCASGDETD